MYGLHPTPLPGIEPGTKRLTVVRSTAELKRNEGESLPQDMSQARHLLFDWKQETNGGVNHPDQCC